MDDDRALRRDALLMRLALARARAAHRRLARVPRTATVAP